MEALEKWIWRWIHVEREKTLQEAEHRHMIDCPNGNIGRPKAELTEKRGSPLCAIARSVNQEARQLCPGKDVRKN